MSAKKVIGVTAIVVLGCGTAGYFWLRTRAERSAAAAIMRDPEPVTTASESAPPAQPVSSPLSQPPSGNKPAPSAVDPGLPLRSGEVLEYSANVANLNNVAKLRLQIAEHKNFLGRSAWHLQAFAHTESPLRMVFVLDDEFDSYSDAVSMSSLQYEMHLNERGQKVDSVQRMTTTGKEPAPADATQARVLPGTRDPLGMLEYLRHLDWAKTTEMHCPVYDGHALYDVRAKVIGLGEAVSVPAGGYKAAKIELRVLQNGEEMKDARFTIYIANNVGRTPVLLEAVMPVATARVELQSVR